MKKYQLTEKLSTEAQNPAFLLGAVSDWASTNLKDKVKFHLEMSVTAWHDWNEDLPHKVEVICNEVKSRRGQFLTVRRWVIVPPESGLKECLVAEIDNDIQIHINHLAPAVF